MKSDICANIFLFSRVNSRIKEKPLIHVYIDCTETGPFLDVSILIIDQTLIPISETEYISLRDHKKTQGWHLLDQKTLDQHLRATAKEMKRLSMTTIKEPLISTVMLWVSNLQKIYK